MTNELGLHLGSTPNATTLNIVTRGLHAKITFDRPFTDDQRDALLVACRKDWRTGTADELFDQLQAALTAPAEISIEHLPTDDPTINPPPEQP